MTYTEYIDELYSLVESVCNNYDYYVMVEAANEDSNLPMVIEQKNKEKEEKKKNFIKSAKVLIGKIIDSIIAFAKKMKTQILVKIKNIDANKRMVLKNDMELTDGFVNFDISLTKSVRDSFWRERGSIRNLDKLKEKFENASKEVSVKKGTKLMSPSEFLRNNDYIVGSIADLKNSFEKTKIELTPETTSALSEILNLFTKYQSDFYNSFKLALKDSCSEKRLESAEYVKDMKMKSDNKSESGVQSESVSINELRARLLIEASEILGNEIQKPIDDIPEEDPEIDDEYPEDISGGNGEREDYLEDIKDLVDGDKDAINILTVDDDSKTINEAVNFAFEW